MNDCLSEKKHVYFQRLGGPTLLGRREVCVCFSRDVAYWVVFDDDEEGVGSICAR